MVILSADDWVYIFILFVVWMRHPAQGAVGSWVMLGQVLYSSGFLCVCSHCLILSKVSYLVV